MSLALLVLFQAGTQTRVLPPTPPKSETAVPDYQFKILPDRDCASNDPEEIVVCGSRGGNDRYRLPSIPTDFEIEALKAETQLMEGVTGDLHVESEALANGMISKRMMVTIKTKF